MRVEPEFVDAVVTGQALSEKSSNRGDELRKVVGRGLGGRGRGTRSAPVFVDFPDNGGDLLGRRPVIWIGQQRRMLPGLCPLTGTPARRYPAPICVQWNDIRSGFARHVTHPNLSESAPWNWISATPALR
ncbi:Uncharacterised protein [Mycobacterium tuberculosis]|uniref:Uncharacterized protein n=1 Tax=Mycobacterium tuberculosis TaxID=1773 RepID=A0A0T9CR09_MYCTX|nr:Uncharacterised protein [Mycobacterium tuberculosis]CFE49584.1 Uncharacterised protein [Mycobacterium tuberculosis]CFR82965.1 Uncharacterised protein [Mycobacterium tuberculosis]CKO51175.1 Uncharacterised protein [Mycobacterium tuberculosis]CKR04264.1 Uncharacterised protein [Mycobacterium tuberculosis]